jgi:hypothetical protein
MCRLVWVPLKLVLDPGYYKVGSYVPFTYSPSRRGLLHHTGANSVPTGTAVSSRRQKGE